AHAERRLPVRQETPPALGVDVAAAHAVALVAAQTANDTELRPDEVLETQPTLGGTLPLGAQCQTDGLAGQAAVGFPARVEAAVLARQVDHATAAAGRRLREHGHREHLPRIPAANVEAGLEPHLVVQWLFDPQPCLALAHGLAGIEGKRPRAGRARVLAHLVGRQALGILRAEVEAVGGQGERGASARGSCQPDLCDVATGAGTLAGAAAVQVLGVGPVAALIARPPGSAERRA